MFAVVEASSLDVRREPRIAQEAGEPEFKKGIGPVWSLNSKDSRAGRGPCIFYDGTAADGMVCTIYETRPNSCRVYNCDTGLGAQLKAAGVLTTEGRL